MRFLTICLNLLSLHSTIASNKIIECEYILEENGHTCLLEDIEVKRAHQKYQFELFVSNDDSDVTMENITTINVFNSEFQFIPREIFEYFPNLKVLNMNKVKLKKILKNNFENAANLEILNMKKNYLVELHETDFASLKNLRKLDLSGNVKLKFVAPNFTVQMPNLESLNMLDCSCVNFKIEDLNPNDAEWIFENCNEPTNSSLEDYNDILYAEYTDIPLDVPKDSTNFILYDVVDSIVSFFNSESEEYEEDEYDESTTNPNDTQYMSDCQRQEVFISCIIILTIFLCIVLAIVFIRSRECKLVDGNGPIEKV